ncbi:hypothetical protein CEN39_24555 [Fischerella thermalis CCMEE 5201]|nr:hypothetical protein CEN39_24555 [Fischerella thermalis CCMEE 5201]
MLVVGCWLLVVGGWLLVVGGWLFTITPHTPHTPHTPSHSSYSSYSPHHPITPPPSITNARHTKPDNNRSIPRAIVKEKSLCNEICSISRLKPTNSKFVSK